MSFFQYLTKGPPLSSESKKTKIPFNLKLIFLFSAIRKAFGKNNPQPLPDYIKFKMDPNGPLSQDNISKGKKAQERTGVHHTGKCIQTHTVPTAGADIRH